MPGFTCKCAHTIVVVCINMVGNGDEIVLGLDSEDVAAGVTTT